ncbi:hypothetical protein M8J76_005144 [Diaphorina citri]|nr:hypothetical protein M8J75_001577 [Diaphorina citri]KAI5744786.1 hypothetical protein M8J76_005144 [Diaphorina citri]
MRTTSETRYRIYETQCFVNVILRVPGLVAPVISDKIRVSGKPRDPGWRFGPRGYSIWRISQRRQELVRPYSVILHQTGDTKSARSSH